MKYIIKIAKPTADSLAATVSIYKAKICPKISSKKTEKKIKLRLTPTSISSRHINNIRRLRLYKIKPKIPYKKMLVEEYNKADIGKNIFIKN